MTLALIARLEKSDCPSFDLDDAIADAIHYQSNREPPAYTSDIMCLKLLPPGFVVTKVRRPEGSVLCHVYVNIPGQKKGQHGKHRYGCIALCIAALKARTAEQEAG